MPEKDFLAQLVTWAQQNALVRAMIMTSNRGGADGAIDALSDYDVILYVTDIAPFTGSEAWLWNFGNVLLRTALEKQMDSGMAEYYRGVFYDDGTKVDFTVGPTAVLPFISAQPKLPAELDLGYRVLLDKDGLTAGLQPPTRAAYIPAKPSAGEFRQLIEDFWWDATYVAKYLWRDDYYAARLLLDSELRIFVLKPMLEWLVEVENGWTVRPGAFGRRLKRNLKPEVWAELEKTYAGPDVEDAWRALFQMAAVFRACAETVGRSLGYTYPAELEERMAAYVRGIQGMTGRG